MEFDVDLDQTTVDLGYEMTWNFHENPRHIFYRVNPFFNVKVFSFYFVHYLFYLDEAMTEMANAPHELIATNNETIQAMAPKSFCPNVCMFNLTFYNT